MKTVKHRYIAFGINQQPEACITSSSLIQAVVGKLRLARDQPEGSRFRILQYDAMQMKGIVRSTPQTAVEWIKNLMRSVSEINGNPVDIQILGTSGTLKALRNKYLEGADQKQ
jgi:RNase P/RNase MRP subunit POP5